MLQKKIYKGEVLTKANVCLKRPGNGYFNTSDLKKVLGKKATRNIPVNVQIKNKDI